METLGEKDREVVEKSIEGLVGDQRKQKAVD